MTHNESAIETTTDTLTAETGGWYYARYSLLERYGLEGDNGNFQYKLLEWLRENNKDKMGDDDYFIIRDGGTIITIPATKISVMYIIMPQIEGLIHGTQAIDIGSCDLDEPQWKDADGNTVTEWTSGKPIKLSVGYQNKREEDTDIIFKVYRKIDRSSGSEEICEMEGVNANGIAEAEWTHTIKEPAQNTSQESELPRYFFTAQSGNGTVRQSDILQMSMDLKIVVVDRDNVVVGKAKIDLFFTVNQKLSGKERIQ